MLDTCSEMKTSHELLAERSNEVRDVHLSTAPRDSDDSRKKQGAEGGGRDEP